MSDLDALALTFAGRLIVDGWDRLSRYCGLAWSGGPPETWAYRYYDLVDTSARDRPDQVDVLATAALHPGLSRSDLSFFWDEADALGRWLNDIPGGLPLVDADDRLLEQLDRLAMWQPTAPLTLLTKVAHRKRPQLIPLVDRDVLDLYRPTTGQRSAHKAWPALLRALRADATDPANAATLKTMGESFRELTGRTMSTVRMMDIIIWMGGQR